MVGSGEERVVAFVLAVVEIGKEYEVLEKIRKVVEEVGASVEAYVVYGEYDVAAKIVAKSLRDLDKVVTRIRGLPGILRTVTLVASS